MNKLQASGLLFHNWFMENGPEVLTPARERLFPGF